VISIIQLYSSKSVELLRTCLSVHKPELLYVIDSTEEIHVDRALGNKLRSAVGNEFCREGLLANSEPNEYGLELEDLIDELGRLFVY
jgi:hypothetical protein